MLMLTTDKVIFYLIIYCASQHSSYQAWTAGEGERVTVMVRRKMRKREGVGMGVGGLEEARGGWRGPRDEGGAELCQHM